MVCCRDGIRPVRSQIIGLNVVFPFEFSKLALTGSITNSTLGGIACTDRLDGLFQVCRQPVQRVLRYRS